MNMRALLLWAVPLLAATASMAVGGSWAWGQFRAAGGCGAGGVAVVSPYLSAQDGTRLADAMLALHPEYRSLNAGSFETLVQGALLASAQAQLCAGLWPEFQRGGQVFRTVADAVLAVGDRLKLTTPMMRSTAQGLCQQMQNQLDHGFLKGAGQGEYNLCLDPQQAAEMSPEARLTGP